LFAGTILALFIILFKSAGNTSSPWFMLYYVTGPWLILDALFFWLKQFRGIAISGALMLALEIAIYYSVFISPHSSTAPLVYIVKPFLQLLLILPFGLLIKMRDKPCHFRAGKESAQNKVLLWRFSTLGNI